MAKVREKPLVKYGHDSQTQLKTIVDAFLEAMRLERSADEPEIVLPNAFKTEFVKHLWVFSRERILSPGGDIGKPISASLESYIKLGHLMSGPAQYMAQLIIEYFEGCRERYLGSDHHFDPTEQFFSEFYSWLISLSSEDRINSHLEKQIKRRVKYLSLIERANNGQFWEEGYRFPRRGLIADLKDILNNEVLHIIKVHPHGRSIREELDDLSMMCREQLSALVMCLRFALHDAPNTNTYPNLLMQVRKGFLSPSGNISHTQKELKSTVSGRLIWALCKEICELEVRSLPQATRIESGAEDHSTGMSVFRYDSVAQTARFGLEETRALLLRSRNHGLIKAFVSDQAAVTAYIVLCNLLLELASVSNVIRKAHLLAGEGGNILMCGYVHKHTEMITMTYRRVVEELARNLDIIVQRRQVYDAKLQPSSRTKEKTRWAKTSGIFDGHQARLAEIGSEVREITDSITKRLKYFQREGWYAAFREEIDAYMRETEMIYNRVCNPSIPPIKPSNRLNLLLTGDPDMMRATDDPAPLASTTSATGLTPEQSSAGAAASSGFRDRVFGATDHDSGSPPRAGAGAGVSGLRAELPAGVSASATSAGVDYDFESTTPSRSVPAGSRSQPKVAPPSGDGVFDFSKSPRARYFSQVRVLHDEYEPKIRLRQGQYWFRGQVAINRRIEHMGEIHKLLKRWQEPALGEVRPCAGELLYKLNKIVDEAKLRVFGMTDEYQAMEQTIKDLQRDKAAMTDTTDQSVHAALAAANQTIKEKDVEIATHVAEKAEISQKLNAKILALIERDRVKSEHDKAQEAKLASQGQEIEELKSVVFALRDAMERSAITREQATTTSSSVPFMP